MSATIQAEAGRQGTGGRLPSHVIALIRERRRRLAAIRRYDRYIAEAAGDLTLQAFWRNLKRQDREDAQRLRNRLDQELERSPVAGQSVRRNLATIESEGGETW